MSEDERLRRSIEKLTAAIRDLTQQFKQTQLVSQKASETFNKAATQWPGYEE